MPKTNTTMKALEQYMTDMRLYGMKQCWKALRETRRHHELSLADGLEILLQAEKEDKQNRRFDRLRVQARFRYQASLEELLYDPHRGLHKDQLSELATSSYIEKGESVLITGATGCGKSFLASALGHHACTHGKRVLYFNTQKLLLKTKLCRLEGTLIKFMERLSRTDLLILDDFGLKHFEPQHQQDFMEIIEDRHARKATVIASQLPVANWYEIIGEQTIADAILDRLVHSSHRIELKGESLRKKH